MPRAGPVAKGYGVMFLVVLKNSARTSVGRKPPFCCLALDAGRSPTKVLSTYDSESPFGSRGPAPEKWGLNEKLAKFTCPGQDNPKRARAGVPLYSPFLAFDCGTRSLPRARTASPEPALPP